MPSILTMEVIRSAKTDVWISLEFITCVQVVPIESGLSRPFFCSGDAPISLLYGLINPWCLFRCALQGYFATG